MAPVKTQIVIAAIAAYVVLVIMLHLSLALTIIVIATYYAISKLNQLPNPYAINTQQPRRPYEHDQKKRDAVLKQSFSTDKLPDGHLDAIVIGSGIGGLCTAALLSKVGKKVLVLEQHDMAGGGCHIYNDKG
jgi:all-trans-retinol 13,14-reductase